MSDDSNLVGTCHCGAVSITLPALPAQLTHCNCSLCRRYGTMWTYAEIAQTSIAAGRTDTYAWNGKHIDFHRCAHCGCITHWYPRDPKRTTLGINARLFDPAMLAGLPIRRVDSGETGHFL